MRPGDGRSGRPTAPPGGRASGAPPKRHLPVGTAPPPRPGDPWGARLARVVHARLGENARIVLELPTGTLAPGSFVAWRGQGTPGTAHTLGWPSLVLDPPRVDGVVLGPATDESLATVARLRSREQAVAEVGRRVLGELSVPAKVVRAEAEAGGARFVLLLVAEERVDFRTVLRAIGARTRERVELRVVGERDAARLVGGVGPCGLQLCCNTFLSDFAPVAVRMARDQGLPIHPERINGSCGRLLCCLVYEDAAYRASRAAVPKLGELCELNGVSVEVVGVDVLAGLVRLRGQEGPERVVAYAELSRPSVPPRK